MAKLHADEETIRKSKRKAVSRFGIVRPRAGSGTVSLNGAINSIAGVFNDRFVMGLMPYQKT
jgi:phosphoribosylformylglycinamidine (FGAM) synthase-like amidotransferase family enzyme